MIVTRTKTGEWVLLNEHKEIVQYFNTREEAIEALKSVSPKKETQECKHGNLEAEAKYAIWNMAFPHPIEWIETELREGHGAVKSKSWGWSLGPVFNRTFNGRKCRSCGLIILADGSIESEPPSNDAGLANLNAFVKGWTDTIPSVKEDREMWIRMHTDPATGVCGLNNPDLYLRDTSRNEPQEQS